jgi:2-keto-4-pentenoate hydratase/2-oxohepta-3-ene-1,7-dioic acid hydratase in catechol pathway
VDWGAGLAAVIGRTARDVPVAHALDYVAGYTCHNDITDRAAQTASLPDMLAAKARDTFAPVGPFLVPRYLVPQPDALGVRCLVNGEVRQDYSLSGQHWSVARCLAHLSGLFTLHPGDVIALGTGPGTGWAAGAPQPRSLAGLAEHVRSGGGVFLRSGDLVAVEIEGIGVLENGVT